MLKKILLVAALAAPSLAFAGTMDIVIRVGGVQAPYEYRPAAYQYGHGTYREMRWLNEEQERQHDRIAQGIRSGELTRQEVERLQREQRDIRQMEAYYLSDRRLSPREFDRLQDELRDASRHIQTQKNDRQDRDYRMTRW